MLRDGFLVGNGNSAIDFAHDAMRFGNDRARGAGGMNENANSAISDFHKWQKHHGRRRFTKCDGFEMARDSDDFEGIAIEKMKTPADRIFTGPKMTRHGIIDQGNPSLVFVAILLSQPAAA